MVEISGSERLIYDTGERNGRAEVAIILNDLIAELREGHYKVDGRVCNCNERMLWPCWEAELADRAEARLREIQGE